MLTFAEPQVFGKAGYVAARIQVAQGVPTTTQVRFYRKSDYDLANQICRTLNSLGVQGASAIYIIGFEDSTAVRPNHFEIWFGLNSLK